jgi:hypothetical protein
MVKTALIAAAMVRRPGFEGPTSAANSTAAIRRCRGPDGGDARQNIGQPGLRIDVVHLGGDDQAVYGGGSLTAAVGAREQPRFSAQSDTAQCSFRRVVCKARGRHQGTG